MSDAFPVPGLVSLVVALQFAAFGWRINREISVGDKGEKTWIPLTDGVNLVSMLLTLIFCFVVPMLLQRFTRLSLSIFAFSSILIFFHPISMAAHYELFVRSGRLKYSKTIEAGKTLDFDALPWCPRQEFVSVMLSVLSSIGIAVAVFVRT